MSIEQKPAYIQSSIAKEAEVVQQGAEQLVAKREEAVRLEQQSLTRSRAVGASKERQEMKLQWLINALRAAQQLLDQLCIAAAANDHDTLIEMEPKLTAEEHVQRPEIYSLVLTPLAGSLVVALQTFVGNRMPLHKFESIFRASRNGARQDKFWSNCKGRQNTLTIVRVKGNGFVFGIFTAYQLPAGEPTVEKNLTDPPAQVLSFALLSFPCPFVLHSVCLVCSFLPPAFVPYARVCAAPLAASGVPVVRAEADRPPRFCIFLSFCVCLASRRHSAADANAAQTAHAQYTLITHHSAAFRLLCPALPCPLSPRFSSSPLFLRFFSPLLLSRFSC